LWPSFNKSFNTKHRSCSGQELDISRSSLQRILTKDLHLHAYKVQLTQELKPTDHAKPREFVEWIMEQQQVDAEFSNKIIFSDEAHFHLDDFVNRQNCRIWGSEFSGFPRVIVETQMLFRKCGSSGNNSYWCSLPRHDNPVFGA
ncbi:hypothetical protein WN55_07749, partial [Dufourea novaeangliae]